MTDGDRDEHDDYDVLCYGVENGPWAANNGEFYKKESQSKLL